MKKMYFPAILLLLFCIPRIANSVYTSKVTGINDSIETKIDTLIARMGFSSETPGGVIGIIKDGSMIFKKAYGLADYETKMPNTTSTLFNLASTSKQFTAAAILLLEKQKKLSLKDDIRKYLTDFPDYGNTITIEHLIHHTSGIKSSDVLCLMAGTLFSENNREGDYDFIAGQKSLNFKPGDEYNYSNSGYVLLGKIVEKISGMKFSKFVEENIFTPLGMTHSYIYDNPGRITDNSATGHIREGEGKYRESGYENSSLTGVSNVYTSIEDILQWDNNFYNNKLGRWDFSKEMTALTPLNNGDECNYAFGLHISEYKGLKTISHGGGSGDFSTFYLQIPSEKLSVVCLFNINAGATSLAYKIADLFIKESPQNIAHPSKPEKADIDSSLLQICTGKYFDNAYWIEVTITREGDHLIFEAPYQGRFDLYPSSDTSFFVTFADLQVVFSKNDKGEITKGAILQGDDKFELTYLGKDITHPEEEQLNQYAGNFYCEDIDVTYPVLFRDGKLFMVLPESTAEFCHSEVESELIPEHDDYFASPVSGIRFTRDTDNEISGFILWNVGRVRNLVFSKVE